MLHPLGKEGVHRHILCKLDAGRISIISGIKRHTEDGACCKTSKLNDIYPTDVIVKGHVSPE